MHVAASEAQLPTSGRLVSGRLPLSVGGVDESPPGPESVVGTVESGCGPLSTTGIWLFELSSLLQATRTSDADERPSAIAARR